MPKATVTGGGSDYTEGTPDDGDVEVKPAAKKPAAKKTTAAKTAKADDKTE